MLSTELNKALTRVGPGTPMGEVMRRYWIPALLSWELVSDAAPTRTRLLGEDLIAFRDTSGRVGVLDEFCPHRLTSLWLGRNEQDGIRCVYHGWKFDVAGRCVDQMNEPEPFTEKVRMTSYQAVEHGGVVWVYMGPADRQPPLPDYEWTRLPENHRDVTKVVEECNWLQALEGGIDTSHAPILHRALKLDPAQPGIPMSGPFVKGEAPKLEVEPTDYGFRYFGVRKLGDDQQYVRGYHFVMPWTQLRPGGPNRDTRISGHYWVPIDDHRCLVWNFYYDYEQPIDPSLIDPQDTGNTFGLDVDVENGFRSIRNRSNDWMIDRAIQKTDTFTGILGVNTQDRALQELMGPIVDRSREQLGPADRAIIVARQLLTKAIETVADGGDAPGTQRSLSDLRAADVELPMDGSWRESLVPRMDPTANRV
ncbi:MAG: Rieske 2Fe-2S domain-containing protein [Chloroflexi bacterium]|nr:Rieske 2Fe-2S domain-containing protein [Chloroflexota bacterium]